MEVICNFDEAIAYIDKQVGEIDRLRAVLSRTRNLLEHGHVAAAIICIEDALQPPPAEKDFDSFGKPCQEVAE